jgi:hypothetical protein
MARYYRISPRIWADNAWSETARLLALYLRRDRSTVHSAAVDKSDVESGRSG